MKNIFEVTGSLQLVTLFGLDTLAFSQKALMRKKCSRVRMNMSRVMPIPLKLAFVMYEFTRPNPMIVGCFTYYNQYRKEGYQINRSLVEYKDALHECRVILKPEPVE